MRPKYLFLSFALAALLPVWAQAEIKTYDLDVIRVANNTTLTVTGNTTRLTPLFGSVEINDESNGKPTLVSYTAIDLGIATTRTDIFAGPNSFVYTRVISSNSPVPGQTGIGDSEGFVQWNTLSSWTALGGRFCKGSNEVGNPLGGPFCLTLGFGDEITLAVSIPSADYDFPLWTFDAQGDFSADSFIWNITSGGQSNHEWFSKGLLRTNVPAMSQVGMAVLGVSLMFLGARTLRRRRDETRSHPKA